MVGALRPTSNNQKFQCILTRSAEESIGYQRRTIFALGEEEAVPVSATVVVLSCAKRADLGSCEVHLHMFTERIARLINTRSTLVLAHILTGSTVILVGVEEGEEEVGQDQS